jgi:tetratricopeptide (TPR) repeat protein
MTRVVSSHRFRGNKYWAEKNLDGALTEYSEAIRLDPTDVLALTNRGRIYVDREDYNHAIADFNEAIRLDPNWSPAYYCRGRMYYTEKDYDRALADLDRAIQLNSRYANAFLVRGVVHRAKGDVSQAIDDYDHAIQINPVDAVAYGFRCGARIEAGQDLHAALSDCNESLRLEPRQTSASTHRGFIHLRLRDANRRLPILTPRFRSMLRTRGRCMAAVLRDGIKVTRPADRRMSRLRRRLGSTSR